MTWAAFFCMGALLVVLVVAIVLYGAARDFGDHHQ